MTKEVNSSEAKTEIKLVDIPISDQNTAFNLIVNFITIAQKRGCYTIQESAKIWEAIKFFSPPQEEEKKIQAHEN
jgi:hypothetical protein